jgi:hypothetical protein
MQFLLIYTLCGIVYLSLDVSLFHVPLAGQRLSKPQKGINIIDGKKVVVKQIRVP